MNVPGFISTSLASPSHGHGSEGQSAQTAMSFEAILGWINAERAAHKLERLSRVAIDNTLSSSSPQHFLIDLGAAHDG